MMTPVLFLLYSGFLHLTFASNRLRNFTLMERVYGDKAANKCIEINGSLVTIYDEEDIEFVNQFASKKVGPVWLGLQRSPQFNVSKWSNGAPISFHMFNTSDVNLSHGKQVCEAIENNTWKGFNCSDRKPFMCSRQNNYTLIEKKSNWCQAQDYCRKHFDDLVSISNNIQNEQVIEKGKNQTFWIGLMHDEWQWEDKGCSTYRKWKNATLIFNCTTLDSSLLLNTQECINDYDVVCSTGTVRIKVIKKNLTWEQAYDYCKDKHSRLLQIENAKDEFAVEQWLNMTEKDVNNVFWIALRQSRVFGFWIWSDKMVDYNNWKNKEIPQMPMSENCGVIERDNQSWRWRDKNCLLPLPFLCEQDISYMTYNIN